MNLKDFMMVFLMKSFLKTIIKLKFQNSNKQVQSISLGKITNNSDNTNYDCQALKKLVITCKFYFTS